CLRSPDPKLLKIFLAAKLIKGKGGLEDATGVIRDLKHIKVPLQFPVFSRGSVQREKYAIENHLMPFNGKAEIVFVYFELNRIVPLDRPVISVNDNFKNVVFFLI